MHKVQSEGWVLLTCKGIFIDLFHRVGANSEQNRRQISKHC